MGTPASAASPADSHVDDGARWPTRFTLVARRLQAGRSKSVRSSCNPENVSLTLRQLAACSASWLIELNLFLSLLMDHANKSSTTAKAKRADNRSHP